MYAHSVLADPAWIRRGSVDTPAWICGHSGVDLWTLRRGSVDTRWTLVCGFGF
jgi:hypothetical protein